MWFPTNYYIIIHIRFSSSSSCFFSISRLASINFFLVPSATSNYSSMSSSSSSSMLLSFTRIKEKKQVIVDREREYTHTRTMLTSKNVLLLIWLVLLFHSVRCIEAISILRCVHLWTHQLLPPPSTSIIMIRILSVVLFIARNHSQLNLNIKIVDSIESTTTTTANSKRNGNEKKKKDEENRSVYSFYYNFTCHRYDRNRRERSCLRCCLLAIL